MRKAYRFRIYPSKEQRRILERTLQTCRILYNNLLAERRDSYRKTGRSPGYYEQKRSLVLRKLGNPYVHQVHSQVLQDVALRLQRGFENFFERTRKGEKAGYPRFKGWNRYNSFTYPQYGNGVVLKDGGLAALEDRLGKNLPAQTSTAKRNHQNMHDPQRCRQMVRLPHRPN